jgi:hypothetical protein
VSVKEKLAARLLELALVVLAFLTVCEYVALENEVQAAVDLVTVPTRDAVQLTIYNSEDITLVKDKRILTFKKGENQIQFSWANTLIDPTSVELRALKNRDSIEIKDISYPANRPDTLIWNIESKIDGAVPVEITYFTSGITWAADYVALADEKEEKIELVGKVAVANNSGEDYENAQTRLIVGTINLVEKIADLARMGRPPKFFGQEIQRKLKKKVDKWDEECEDEAPPECAPDNGRPKKIIKEGLSEYFIYTVEGTETVPNRWAKRLPSLRVTEIPIKVIYRYSDTKYGRRVTKFYKFKNRKVEDKPKEEPNLGEEPLPDGMVRVFKRFDSGNLAFVGQHAIKYMPIGEDVELNLGPDPDVLIERKVMDLKKLNFTTEMWGRTSRIVGYDTKTFLKTRVKNTKDLAIQFEIERTIGGDWELDCEHAYDKLDENNIRFVMQLKPGEERTFTYTVTHHHGKNSRR